MSIITDVYAASLNSRGNPTWNEVYTESGAHGRGMVPSKELLLAERRSS